MNLGKGNTGALYTNLRIPISFKLFPSKTKILEKK